MSSIVHAFFIGGFFLVSSNVAEDGGDMRIGIFGSCISRDIFREMKLDNLVKEYRQELLFTLLLNQLVLMFPKSIFQNLNSNRK